jgi:hypothetical protein
MANELSEYEIRELTGRGPCHLHTHEVNINEHKHLDALQALEVVVRVSADYMVSYREDIIMVDTSGGNVTVTLPKSRGGKKFYIIKISALNVLTVRFSGNETILGDLSVPMNSLGEGIWFKGIPQGYIPL